MTMQRDLVGTVWRERDNRFERYIIVLDVRERDSGGGDDVLTRTCASTNKHVQAGPKRWRSLEKLKRRFCRQGE
jgi:hypothetical protein